MKGLPSERSGGGLFFGAGSGGGCGTGRQSGLGSGPLATSERVPPRRRGPRLGSRLRGRTRRWPSLNDSVLRPEHKPLPGEAPPPGQAPPAEAPPRRRPGSRWEAVPTTAALRYCDLSNWAPAFAGEVHVLGCMSSDGSGRDGGSAADLAALDYLSIRLRSSPDRGRWLALARRRGRSGITAVPCPPPPSPSAPPPPGGGGF